MNTIEQLLHKGHLLLAIKLLEVQLVAGAHRKALANWKQQYNRLQEEHIAGQIDWEEYQKRLEEVKSGLAQLGRQLNGSIPSTELSRVSINMPILAITPAKARIKELEDLFAKFGFSNVHTCTWEDKPGFDSYPIVAFDNMDLLDESAADQTPFKLEQRKARQERATQMDYCVRSSACLILHYGNQFSWVSENRQRAHAANSKFALYARLMELIEFIEAYRV